jgi:hypothetical protein
MGTRFVPAALVLAAAAFACVTAANAQEMSHPVQVNRCEPSAGHVPPAGFVPGYYPYGRYYWNDVYGYRYYQPGIASNPTLAIDYVNVSSKAATEIEFGLLARSNLVAEVRDVGTFSPNVEIKHDFGLSPNVFPLGTGLPRCVALRVVFANGSKWVNPHLPELRRALYQPH